MDVDSDRRTRPAWTRDPRLLASLEHCRRILRDKARSFAFASRFLPDETRRATQAMYAFFRTVDDVADECRFPGDPAALARLDEWQRWVEDGCRPDPSTPVRYAAGWAVGRYRLHREHLLELLDGVRGDVRPHPPATVADLERYCYRVAATVGLTMASVLGATQPAAQRHAADLGIAMQLTNIVRDVGEDVARGRMYLPADEVASFGYSYGRLAERRLDDAFVALLRHQIERARGYYRRAEPGLVLLPARVQFPIRLASRLYEGILDKVEQHDYDVFGARAHLGRGDKLRVAGRVLAALPRSAPPVHPSMTRGVHRLRRAR